MVGHLAGLWFPGGIRPGQVRDDELTGTRRGRVHLGVAPQMWGPVTSWEELRARVEQAGPGGAAFVVTGRPREAGHALALAATGDSGLVVVDPVGPGQVRLVPVPSGRPLAGVLAGLGPDRSCGPGPGCWSSAPAAGSCRPAAGSAASGVGALTDPAHSRIAETAPPGQRIPLTCRN